MPRKRATGVWMFDAGEDDLTVTAGERVERAREVYLRFRDPAKIAAGAVDPRTWKPTGIFLRTASNELVQKKVQLAQQAAYKLSFQLKGERECLAQTGVKLATSPAPRTPPTSLHRTGDIKVVSSTATPAGLSLLEGIELALDTAGVGTSKYDRAERSSKDAETRLRNAIGILNGNQERVGQPFLTWDELRPAHAQIIWKRMLDEHMTARRSGKIVHGQRKAEQAITDLFGVAEWLFRNTSDLAARPRGLDKNWKSKLKADWQRRAGPTARATNGKRHSAVEIAKIFRATSDERVRLAETLAQSRGLGYIATRWRSHLELATSARHPHGSLLIEHSKTNCVSSPLSEEQGVQARFALSSGYLRLLEAARVAGAINDYPLFPHAEMDYQQVPACVIVAMGLTPLTALGCGVLATDPRGRLAMELHAEQRSGQGLSVFRSMVTLVEVSPDQYEAVGAGNLGGFTVLGKVTKPGGLESFSIEQRRALDHALATYLRDYEAAWTDGGEDYPIYPPGRLIKGVAVPALNTRDGDGRYLTATRDALRGWFREIEDAAGVTHVRNRGWYGIKRGTSDLVDQLTNDAGVQEAYNGTSDRMLDKHYRDQTRSRQKKTAATLRATVRGVRK